MASSLRFAARHADTATSATATQIPNAAKAMTSNRIDASSRSPGVSLVPASRAARTSSRAPELLKTNVCDFRSLQGYPPTAAAAFELDG